MDNLRLLLLPAGLPRGRSCTSSILAILFVVNVVNDGREVRCRAGRDVMVVVLSKAGANASPSMSPNERQTDIPNAQRVQHETIKRSCRAQNNQYSMKSPRTKTAPNSACKLRVLTYRTMKATHPLHLDNNAIYTTTVLRRQIVIVYILDSASRRSANKTTEGDFHEVSGTVVVESDTPFSPPASAPLGAVPST